MTDELSLLKRSARETWSAGNYDAVADGVWPVGGRVVARAGVTKGDRVLDIGTGTGNAAIAAAMVGGEVIGLDLTPENFAAARRRATEAGVAIDWVEGDAEALPFADASFDAVLSTFGVMFAPRHAVAAREIARVLRPGGRIGLANWAPGGDIAELFRILAAAMPPPPAIAEPPILWGDETHVRDIFAGTGIDPSFERDRVPENGDATTEEFAMRFTANFGPMIKARELLEPRGRWETTMAALMPIFERIRRSPGEYVLVTGTKR
jgi:SAM-dependent methyltransferase